MTQNHIINPETGFLENPAYASQFDSKRKLEFLNLFKSNGMGLYRTCRALGLSTETVNKHYQLDPVFRKAYDEAKVEYTDELECVSRSNALNPRSVIERIFQLKALVPERYGEQRNPGTPHITINIDGKLLESAKKRSEIIDAEIITSTLPQKQERLDNQLEMSANNNREYNDNTGDMPEDGTNA